MYSVSSTFLTKIKEASRIIKAKVEINSTTLTEVDIVDFNIDSSVGADDIPSIGSVTSNKLTLNLINSVNIPAVLINVPIKPSVAIDIGGGVYEWVPMGVFYAVNGDVTVTDKTISITCFDKLSTYDDITYTSSLTYPASVQSVLTEISTNFGITFESQTLPTVNIPYKLDGTLRTVLSQIALFISRNCTMNRLGQVKFIFTNATGVSLDGNNYITFNLNSTNIYKISQLSVIKTDETRYNSGDSTGLNIEYETDIVESQASLDTIFNRIYPLNFYSYNITLQGMPHFDAGDTFTFTDKNNVIRTLIVVNNKFNYNGGFSSEFFVNAPQEPTKTTTVTSGSTLAQAVDRVYSNMNDSIANATNLITGNSGGYIITVMDETTGKPKELVIADTDNINTATKVWRWNSGGLGYSSTGYNGTYGTAITQDGQIVANFITTGTMSADRILGGTLVLGGLTNGNGVLNIRNSSDVNIITADNTGITIEGGYYKIKEASVVNDVISKPNLIVDSNFENIMLTEDINSSTYSATYKAFTIPVSWHDNDLNLDFSRTSVILGGAMLLCRDKNLVGFNQLYTNVNYGINSLIVKSGSFIRYENIVPPSFTSQYTISVWTKRYNLISPTGTSQLKVRISTLDTLYQASTELVSTFTLPSDNDETWVRHTYTFTPPSAVNGNPANLRVTIEGNTANWIIIDGLQLVQGIYPNIYNENDDLYKTAMQANNINGGTLTLGGSVNSAGKFLVRDSSGNTIVGADVNGLGVYDNNFKITSGHLEFNPDGTIKYGSYEAVTTFGAWEINHTYSNAYSTRSSSYNVSGEGISLRLNYGQDAVWSNVFLGWGDTYNERTNSISVLKFQGGLRFKEFAETTEAYIIDIDSATKVTTFAGVTHFLSNISVKGGGVEVGRVDGVASTPYIDFHSSATAVDYDARILCNTGTGVNGGASIVVTAGKLYVTTGFQSGATRYWYTDGKYSLDAQNSDIVGINSLIFADDCTVDTEGIAFPKTGKSGSLIQTDYDVIRALDGNAYFNSNIILHRSNVLYSTWDSWLRSNGDTGYVKMFGNSRTMVFRTDGTTAYGNNGAYPYIWNYGGDDASNRRMVMDSSGNLWTATYGWLSEKFAWISNFANSLGTSGYQKLEGGLIVQWGMVSSVASGTLTAVNLPMTFPNGIYNAVGSMNGGALATDGKVYGVSVNLNSASQIAVLHSHGSARNISWIAFGH